MVFYVGMELGLSFQGRTWVEDIREQDAEECMYWDLSGRK
jgi:hypothetical protein